MINSIRRRSGARAALAAVLAGSAALAVVPDAAGAPTTPIAPAAGSGNGSVLIVHVAGGSSVAGVAARLRASGADVGLRHRFGALRAVSVRVAGGDVAREAARLRTVPGVSAVEPAVSRRLYDVTPDDPDWSRQAAYLGSVAAPSAWARQRGSKQVTIAVLDSGVDLTHTDLAGKVVDRYDAGTKSSDVTDAVGHGTFVSGVAAAATDNGKGVAGSGWDTSLLAVKIADADGNIAIDDEVAGIQWATAHHADVINLSLGGSDPSPTEAAAIAAAQRAGVVVVAAAGNESDTARSYPAAYPGVIAVGATDTKRRTRADFSNYGSWVTVAAPGVSIFSTVPATSQMWGKLGANAYADGDGTSFSTPIVAGEAALLRAQNRTATVSQIRHAIVASAHGFGHLGLGAGQVDFALALRHLVPASAPTAVQADGTAGAIALSAHSTAPRVAFRIDGRPRLRSVPVVNGVAHASFASWGYPNGAHQLRAYDCTAYDECGSSATGLGFAVANPAPAVTSPAAGATLTGLAAVTGASSVGGPLRLLVDGRTRGFVAAGPYAFTVSTSGLADGQHSLQVQSCSADGAHCAGPRSAAVAVTSAALHPEITALSPAHVSPNGDGVHDTATLRFRLPDRESVRVRVLTAAGATVRSYVLGSLATGTHAWTWRPSATAGRLPDGRYSLALDTHAGDRAGWVSRGVAVDTRRPSLSTPTATGRRLFPYRDGYRDSVRFATRLGEPGRLVLTVRSLAGAVVDRVRLRRPAGPATISWNGRTSSGHAAAPGTYRAELALTDAAGNTTVRRLPSLTVSAKRLRTVTRFVVLSAAATRHAGGTAPCATARSRGSRYAGGLLLTNACDDNGFDLAFADYSFTLPSALRYGRVTFAVRGGSTAHPAELSAAFTRTDGSLEIPRYVTVRRAAPSWYGIASVPAAHHVGRAGRIHISLLLDSFFAGRNDFDTAAVRVRVEMTVLQ